MTIPRIQSTLDVALWFFDQSRRDDQHLPAQKLQGLLWVAQLIYAAENHGRMLMPASFIATETGPLEPTIFHAFEDSRPGLAMNPMAPEAENFLGRIWRKYGHHSTDHLTKMMMQNDVFRRVLRREPGSVIPFAEIIGHFRKRTDPNQLVRAPDGRILQKWVPTAKPVSRRF